MQASIDIALLHNLPTSGPIYDSVILPLLTGMENRQLNVVEVPVADVALEWTSEGEFSVRWSKGALPKVVFSRVVGEPSATPLLRALADAGYVVVNDPYLAASASNKLLGPLSLASHGIPVVPSTLVMRGASPYVIDQLRSAHGADDQIIVKPLSGMAGEGVELIHGLDELFERLRAVEEPVLVQPYVESHDIRVFMVGGDVVAAMLRSRAPGEHRANLHQGGVGERVSLSDQELEIATQVAQIAGLDIMGLDMLRTPRGTYVLEMNPNPGLQVEQVTGHSVTTAIAAHLAHVLRRT